MRLVCGTTKLGPCGARDGAEATSELMEWAKPMPQTDYVAMRHYYAKTYGELEDQQIPSKEYLEKKLHELENGEFRAEALLKW